MFSEWRGENVGAYSKANLKKYAADLGLDAARFNPCLDTDKYASIVQADDNEAQGLGLGGTPSFLINGRLLQVRSLDIGEFSRTFDSLLR